MITEVCDVCKCTYTEPDPTIPRKENIPSEELVCGGCWAYINFSNLSTEKVIQIIRKEVKN